MRVESVAGNIYPCRQINDFDYKIGALGSIQRVAVDYCGADLSICGEAIKESVTLFRNRFGRMSLEDIKDAFEMAAAKQLGDINIVAYRGVFTVSIFGEVIAAYATVRDKIVSELEKAAGKELDEEKERIAEARQEECRQEVISAFIALQKENGKFKSVENIPIHWTGILKDAGLLGSDGKLWVEAKNATTAKFKADTRKIKELRVLSTQEADKLESMAFTMTDRERIVQQMFEQPDVLPEELFTAATQLYGRMLVFKQLAPYDGSRQPQLF